MIACMGGWCAKRENCMNHHAADRREPAERLCAPGHDGQGMDTAVVIFKPVGSWERNAAERYVPRATTDEVLAT